MKRAICIFRGHKTIPVRQTGVRARPGGMLPALDGLAVYEPHPDGEKLACTRCGQVLEATP